jgi:hypothetical protein
MGFIRHLSTLLIKNVKFKLLPIIQDCAAIMRLFVALEKLYNQSINQRENVNDEPMVALTSLISGCDTFREQARTSAKRHEHSIECKCALCKCSTNQLICVGGVEGRWWSVGGGKLLRHAL